MQSIHRQGTESRNSKLTAGETTVLVHGHLGSNSSKESPKTSTATGEIRNYLILHTRQ